MLSYPEYANSARVRSLYSLVPMHALRLLSIVGSWLLNILCYSDGVPSFILISMTRLFAVYMPGTSDAAASSCEVVIIYIVAYSHSAMS